MQPTWAELQNRITREDELSITTSINPGRKLSPIWINSLNARCTIIVKTDGEGNSGFPYFKIYHSAVILFFQQYTHSVLCTYEYPLSN